jgi:hypothetical protein
MKYNSSVWEKCHCDLCKNDFKKLLNLGVLLCELQQKIFLPIFCHFWANSANAGCQFFRPKKLFFGACFTYFAKNRTSGQGLKSGNLHLNQAVST